MATKYAVVQRYIRELIASGEFRPGDRIPPESEIIRALNVSRNPVRRALAELAHEGIIFTIRGSGSYVKRTRQDEAINIYCLLDIDNRLFESELIRGMRIAAGEHPNMHLHLILKKPGRSTEEMIEALGSIDTSIPGGIVFLPVLDSERSLNRRLGASLRNLEQPRFSVVQLDRYVPEYQGSYVMSDHALGARRMTEFLLARGHRRIAVFYEHPENTSVQLRLEGVRAVLQLNGTDLSPDRRVLMPWERVRSEGRTTISRLVDEGVTCLFCFENTIAHEICAIAEEEAIAIPEALSICSFDDHSFERQDFITCIKQPLERIGSLGIEIVLSNLESSAAGPVHTLLEPSLVVRESVAELKY